MPLGCCDAFLSLLWNKITDFCSNFFQIAAVTAVNFLKTLFLPHISYAHDCIHGISRTYRTSQNHVLYTQKNPNVTIKCCETGS